MHKPGGEASRNYHDRSFARGLRTPAQLAVDEHVYPGAVQNLGAGQHLEVRRENLCDFRGDEKRRGGSAVHVHFVEGLTVGTVDPDQDRGNRPGTLAEATSTSRNNTRAASPRWAAIAPMSQTTASCLSRSVVATHRTLPCAASVATASMSRRLTRWSTSSTSGSLR